MPSDSRNLEAVGGQFVTLAGERYYAITNVDQMPPFFISLVSDCDLWLFVASNGGLTAGRVSPETALFPYVTVDKIYDSILSTGSRTLVRVEADLWEPFNPEHDGRYAVTRNLYKNALGNKLLFEEVNRDLGLAFRYQWAGSREYGFVRSSELENLGESTRRVDVLDGLQNILPAGTPMVTQTSSSYLVDAYKWSELDAATGLAFFTLFSGITDRAEPCESLKANTVFCLGLEGHQVLLSSSQLDSFRRGETLTTEASKRGVRGAYLVTASLELPAGASRHWQLVADIERSQADCVSLLRELEDPSALGRAVTDSVERGSDGLARIMATADGMQQTAEEDVSTHHYANVLFNVLRGGVFDDEYRVGAGHFRSHVAWFNREVLERHRDFLQSLPDTLQVAELRAAVAEQGDPQLDRLCYEYLPITFGRRHGDPSRPWNQFAIRLRDEHGNRLLTYQGNWRDIFQNWEALLLSYPDFDEHVIAKFVNASTADGYNPYRVTSEGIDWEVEEPDDPWSYIGYWGDHQIIYLLKLMELSRKYHPHKLGELLQRPLYSYANVPYKIKPFSALLQNARDTVVFDHDQAARIDERVASMGADGKLVPDADGRVLRVTLLEKLLVPLLAKLGNLVVDGGIWLNTQRPEWNDANNALVGEALSMVTLYYMRRYVRFLQKVLPAESGSVELSAEVARWLADTRAALEEARPLFNGTRLQASARHSLLMALGEAADRYRARFYEQEGLSAPEATDLDAVSGLLEAALAAIDHSIETNRRDDGLYEAYNLVHIEDGSVEVGPLYPMLEGQVAALSSGEVPPEEAVALVENLFNSAMFRPDQNSFILYPDRELPRFLEKNRVPEAGVAAIPLLGQMLERGDRRIIERDASGNYRFNGAFRNVADLDARLDETAEDYGDAAAQARDPLHALYEQVFNHKAFTGRSGGMFAFEGLGSIYWHMVSKLLLAVAENFFAARDAGADPDLCAKLGELYYRVRAGIGFNKTPAEYGAFPMDPYSHTPAHMGAQQPGMTGQVKEEILARFGELGVRVEDGAVRFEPALLRAQEFAETEATLRYLDVDREWQEVSVPGQGLAFTWCQVPLVYELVESAEPTITLHLDNGEEEVLPGLALPPERASDLFQRTGRIRRLHLRFTHSHLLY